MSETHDATDSHETKIGRSITLPVLDQAESRAPMMGRTKTARWRAAVLTLVNLLMIAHLIQWAIVGMTISPIEPSESMETLEVGVVNAGAIFFLVAILATLIFGRFFCGWLCHVVALQDLCAWMMTRVGIRPKPFRSRFLVYFPILLGGYMFVWPTFKREALAPALEAASLDWPAWLRPVEPIQQWSNGLVVEDFWATMPPWFIAVPFLFICGFACVYFLGAKGFCTYGCPYAAFFKPIDTLAPVRIRVNDDCHQCGYCTSVCTSNVRVSEEVRDFGMVVDPGCMKTLDCVSACPNDALSLGFGKPALGAKPKESAKESRKAALKKRRGRYDLLLWQEILAAVLMLWFFYATRGMLDMVPMLLAGGLAAIGTLILLMGLKLFTEQHVRLYNFKFKQKGRIRPMGYLLLLVALGFVVGSAWSGNARILRWKGDLRYNSSQIPTSVLLRPEFDPSPEQREQAQQAVSSYQRADSFEKGGLGWALNAEHRLRLSYFLSVLDRNEEALVELRRVIKDGEPTDALVLQAGQVLIRSMDDNPGDLDPSEIDAAKRAALLELYEDALNAHPGLHAIRSELSRSAYSVQDREKAEAYWAIEGYSDDPLFSISHASYKGFEGDVAGARLLFEQAAEQAAELDRPAGLWIDIARTALQFGVQDLALELVQRAIDDPSATALTWLAAGEIANAVGQRDLGGERAQHALTMPGIDQPMVIARAAGVLLSRVADMPQLELYVAQLEQSLAQLPEEDERRAEIIDQLEQGRAKLEQLRADLQLGQKMLVQAADEAHDPFEQFAIARGMVFAGNGLNRPELLEQGITVLEQIADEHPEFPIIGHDLSSLFYQMGRGPEALERLIQAAERDEGSALLAQRAAEMSQAVGDEAQAQRWSEEARRRAEQ
jgi:polyferredoxin